MALIKKNMWELFAVLVALFIGGLFVVLIYMWTDLNDKNLELNRGEVGRLASTYHSMLNNKEILLDVAGQQFITNEDNNSSAFEDGLLDYLLAVNPSIAAFAVVSVEGEVTRTSSNLRQSDFNNILQHSATSDSFSRAIDKKQMVLGKTFYMESLDEWVMPLLKTVRDEQGFIKVMMFAALRVDGVSAVFNLSHEINPYDAVIFLRSNDFLQQYAIYGSQWSAFGFDENLSALLLGKVIESVEEKYRLQIEEAAYRGIPVSFDVKHGKDRVAGVMQYDGRYQQWIISQSLKSKVYYPFLVRAGTAIATCLFCIILIFWLFKIITESERRKNEALFYQANHDELTGLRNRNYLVNHIQEWINPKVEPFSVLYIDMDRFKNVNDNFGHVFGDFALKEIASRLKLIRPEGCDLVRYGGDEFLLLLPEINTKKLKMLAVEACFNLSAIYEVHGVSFEIGASIGITRFPEDGHDFDSLIRASDLAMYDAKKYRNTVRFFAENMLDSRQKKILIERYLRCALTNKEIYLVYQPQVKTDGTLYGVEALVRWDSKELGSVPPTHFIPVAESGGLMPVLGNYILHSAMQEMKELQNQVGCDFHVSINISLRQFMHEGFMQTLQKAVKETQFDKLQIVLEITENLFIDDIGYIIPLLDQIHELGMQISMDDFGTGYSSLNILSTLPIDELKIDKSFVDNIIGDDSARKMIKNIISIGKTYEMKVVAEGVEDKDQYELLRDFGCDRFQGYLFSKPVMPEELKNYIAMIG